MRIRPIHIRSDLIDCIRGRGRVTACNRAIELGIVQVLGGFRPSEIIFVPYWCVLVKSIYLKEWVLAVYEQQNEIKVKELPEVDWVNWAGDAAGTHGIYNGDDPQYSHMRHLQSIELKEVHQLTQQNLIDLVRITLKDVKLNGRIIREVSDEQILLHDEILIATRHDAELFIDRVLDLFTEEPNDAPTTTD